MTSLPSIRLSCILIAALAMLAAAAGPVDFGGIRPPLDTTVPAEEDTVFVSDTTDTLADAQQQMQSAQRGGPQKLKIIRRTYNYRRQLGLALGMMAFVAVIFTTTQNWNPD